MFYAASAETLTLGEGTQGERERKKSQVSQHFNDLSSSRAVSLVSGELSSRIQLYICSRSTFAAEPELAADAGPDAAVAAEEAV